MGQRGLRVCSEAKYKARNNMSATARGKRQTPHTKRQTTRTNTQHDTPARAKRAQTHAKEHHGAILVVKDEEVRWVAKETYALLCVKFGTVRN